MKYFLEFVVGALVENSEDVYVDQVEEQRSTVFYIQINPLDVGRIIGKNGRTIGAIRTVLNAAREGGKRVQVEIVENEA